MEESRRLYALLRQQLAELRRASLQVCGWGCRCVHMCIWEGASGPARIAAEG